MSKKKVSITSCFEFRFPLVCWSDYFIYLYLYCSATSFGLRWKSNYYFVWLKILEIDIYYSQLFLFFWRRRWHAPVAATVSRSINRFQGSCTVVAKVKKNRFQARVFFVLSLQRLKPGSRNCVMVLVKVNKLFSEILYCRCIDKETGSRTFVLSLQMQTSRSLFKIQY